MRRAMAIRTCVGCGARACRDGLVRFVADREGRLLLDRRRRLPGRGAWLHREPSCWGTFAGRRGSVRSLRTTPSRAARAALCAELGLTQAEDARC